VHWRRHGRSRHHGTLRCSRGLSGYLAHARQNGRRLGRPANPRSPVVLRSGAPQSGAATDSCQSANFRQHSGISPKRA
jgi:hypothetical protein